MISGKKFLKIIFIGLIFFIFRIEVLSANIAIDSAEYYFEMAIMEYDNGNYNKVIEYLNKAEIHNPNGTMISYLKGKSYYKLDNLEMSIINFDKAIMLGIKSERVNVYCYYLRGEAHRIIYQKDGIRENSNMAISDYEFVLSNFDKSDLLETSKDELKQKIENLRNGKGEITNLTKGPSYEEVKGKPDTYKILFDGKFLCYIFLPKNIEAFSIYKQTPGFYGKNSSQWFTNFTGYNKWNQNNSNFIDRITLLKNLGQYIDSAITQNKLIIFGSKEFGTKTWGPQNENIVYGKDVENFKKMKYSEYWHPEDLTTYDHNFCLFDFSIFDLSISSKVIPLSDEIIVYLDSSRSKDLGKNLYEILYNNETIGFIEVPKNAETFELWYQTQDDILNERRSIVYKIGTDEVLGFIARAEFLKSLGAYYKFAEVNRLRLIVTELKWLNNYIKFGKSLNDLQLLEEIYIKNGNYNIQGYINHKK